MLTKAMIMAAGVGSRLEPLSQIVPKPLVPIANTPAMDILIKHLKSNGIKDIISNTFYKADIIEQHYFKKYSNVNLQFIKEIELSGTAGGVKKCQFFFNKNESFIILSGDGLTDIDINKAYISHKNSGAVATIVTKDVKHNDVSKYGIIVPDKNGFVESFQEKPKIEDAKSNLANTGIYIFDYEIFDFIEQNKFYDFAKNVFPSLMEAGIKINTYTHYGYWSDIGSIEQYKQSNFDILDKKVSSYKPDFKETEFGKYIYGENANISSSAILEGRNIIGNNCHIGNKSIIKNSIIWDNVKIEDNIIIENSIILPNIKVEESVCNEILTESKRTKIYK